MIHDLQLVIMTKNIEGQLKFYKSFLGLNVLFQEENAVGLGINEKLHVILRQDTQEQSHHLDEQKGPVIMTFSVDDEYALSDFKNLIHMSQYKLRNELIIEEYSVYYLFIEDHDQNEVCLSFNRK